MSCATMPVPITSVNQLGRLAGWQHGGWVGGRAGAEVRGRRHRWRQGRAADRRAARQAWPRVAASVASHLGVNRRTASLRLDSADRGRGSSCIMAPKAEAAAGGGERQQRCWCRSWLARPLQLSRRGQLAAWGSAGAQQQGRRPRVASRERLGSARAGSERLRNSAQLCQLSELRLEGRAGLQGPSPRRRRRRRRRLPSAAAAVCSPRPHISPLCIFGRDCFQGTINVWNHRKNTDRHREADWERSGSEHSGGPGKGGFV